MSAVSSSSSSSGARLPDAPAPGSPRILVGKDAHDAGRLAAALVLATVRDNPAAVLGLATGSSPLPLYSALAEADADFSRVSGFALDEYLGLPEGHPQSYAEIIRTAVTAPLGMDPSRVHVPDPHGTDHAAHAADYDAAIAAAGGVDVQILGVGSNGHIGFNEPGSSFDSRTRVVPLAERTRQDNARFFDAPDQVPVQCLTQGIATIIGARHLLLIAHGEHKARPVLRALRGPVTEDFPASIIQRHPQVTVVLDERAASLLGDTPPA